MDEKIEEFELPEYLELTPERIAENQANQDKWRRNAAMSVSADANLARAVAIEADSRLILNTLIESRKIADADRTEKIDRAIQREASRLAQSLAEQGRFDEAAVIEPDDRRSAGFQAMYDAVYIDDAASCDCPIYQETPRGRVLNKTPSDMVFSRKHGSIMPVIKCGICGAMNVRAKPDDVIAQESKQEWRHKS